MNNHIVKISAFIFLLWRFYLRHAHSEHRSVRRYLFPSAERREHPMWSTERMRFIRIRRGFLSDAGSSAARAWRAAFARHRNARNASAVK